MAIEKRFIHFKKFSDFNSKKLSANEANTQYTIGISGEIQDGSPDVLYQSYVWIKDTKQQWTHGQLYDGTDSGAKVYTWNWDGSDSGTLTQEEYDGINEADVVYLSTDGQPALVRKGYSSSNILLDVVEILDLSEYNSGSWVTQNTFTINSDKTYSVEYTNVSIPTKTSQIENDSDFVSSSNLKTINGESILGEGDLTTDIVVSSMEELESLDVPIGTKARIFNYVQEVVYDGLNLGRLLDGSESNPFPSDLIERPEKYTFDIEVDTSVVFPYDENADYTVITIPTQNTIYVDIDKTYYYIRSIQVSAGFKEDLYSNLTDGKWTTHISYLQSFSFRNIASLSDEQFNALIAIAHAFNGSITIPATTIANDYVKTNEGWEYANSTFLDDLYKFFDLLSNSIPTKTSQLENDSNFVASDNIKTINGESILGSGDITIEGESLTESDIAAMGFTKNTGTYSKPSGGIPKSDLSVDVQSALNAANAYQGTVTNVTINGTTKNPVNGVVDLGNVGTYDKPSTGIPKSDLESEVQTSLGKADNSLQVEIFGGMELITLNGFEGRGAGLLYALPHEATGDEDDVLLSRQTVKTINGKSIVGSGNIEIEGGTSSGEVATKEIISVSGGVIEELEPNKVYILDVNLATVSAEIQSIVEPEGDYGEYTVIIVAVDGSGDNRPISLTLPSDVMWPNGVVPDMSQPGYYELSIAYWASTNDGGYNAVLTRFNFVE